MSKDIDSDMQKYQSRDKTSLYTQHWQFENIYKKANVLRTSASRRRDEQLALCE